MYDIVALGELLVDFTPAGPSAVSPAFLQNPGGAPANLLAAASRLGARTALIGCVGADPFGEYLTAASAAQGIDTRYIRRHPSVPTTLAFVHLDGQGERTFHFYRNPGADTMLTKEDVPGELMARCRIFHFGSLSLTDEPARSALVHGAALAAEHGCLISFDPNYRAPLWPSPRAAADRIRQMLPAADIVKVSEEELELLCGTADPEAGSAMLAELGIPLIFVTLGREGALCRRGELSLRVAAPAVEAVDTTGCGDAFFGAALSRLAGLSRSDLSALPAHTLTHITAFACTAGSLVATRKGALSVMPTREEICSLLK